MPDKSRRGMDRARFSRRAFVWCLSGAVASPRVWAQQRAQRIVSTAPSITEALFALGVGERVVGVSKYCDYPAQVVKLPKVGSHVMPDIEAIARLAPDLVVLETATAELKERLVVLRIAFVEVPHGTLEDVYTGIRIMAKAAGVAERGEPLVGQIRSALQAVQVKAQARPPLSVIAILNRRPGMLADLTAVGPGNYVNELLAIAGGANVLATAGMPRYPHISIETVLRADPEMILDLSSTQDTEAMREAARPGVLSLWAQNKTLKAVRAGHVYFGTSNALVVPGPRAPLAAEMLFDFMHGGGTRS